MMLPVAAMNSWLMILLLIIIRSLAYKFHQITKKYPTELSKESVAYLPKIKFPKEA